MNMVYKYVMLQDSCWWLMEHLFESENAPRPTGFEPATFDISYGRSNRCATVTRKGYGEQWQHTFFPGCL